MIMKCPSQGGIPSLALSLTYIMQKSSPSKPQIITILSDIVEHFESVMKIILVSPALSC